MHHIYIYGKYPEKMSSSPRWLRIQALISLSATDKKKEVCGEPVIRKRVGKLGKKNIRFVM